MTRYLESTSYYDNNPCWSGDFASGIRKSITGNNILSFLATELEHESNCTKVWKLVIKYLTTRSITAALVMSHWQTLFGLKCENSDDYLVLS